MFGKPQEIYARVEKLSSLAIETDDNVDIVAAYADGLRVTIHLDLYGRPHQRGLVIQGEEGTLQWSWEPNQIRWSKVAADSWVTEDFICERNDMFVAMAREFLSIVAGGSPSYPLHQAVQVMEILEACRQASASQKVIWI